MSNSNPRIDRVFQGYDTPPKELLNTIILSLDDHYADSNIKSSNPPNTFNTVTPKSAAKYVELEGRKFLVRVEEL